MDVYKASDTWYFVGTKLEFAEFMAKINRPDTAIPLTTAEWQRVKLGDNLKRSLKWATVSAKEFTINMRPFQEAMETFSAQVLKFVNTRPEKS